MPDESSDHLNEAQTAEFGLTQDRAAVHFNRCVAQARDLAGAAELLLRESGKHHIAFALSVFAFEELGKAAMIAIAAIVGTIDVERAKRLLRQLDDHEKKLFWAFWSPWGIGERADSIQKIGEYRDIATRLHEGRLGATYVGPDSKAAPSSAVDREFAEKMLGLLTLQIEIAESAGLRDMPEEDRALLSWLFEAVDDKEKAPQIFGTASIAKRKELGQFGWVRWLKQQFDDAQRQSDEFLARELARDPKQSPEPWKPKWRITLTIDSSSHSIRRNAFDVWNQHSNYIKLALDHNHKAKKRVLVNIELPALIHAGHLWDAGWEMAHTLIVALNVGSLGLFWFETPQKHTEYYKKIVDLDSNSELKISVQPAPIVDFGNQAFTQETMSRVIRAYAALHAGESAQWRDTLKSYIDGLRILGKTDIYLRGEGSALEAFTRAFAAFLRDVEASGRSVTDAFGELLRQIGVDKKDPERAAQLAGLVAFAQNNTISGTDVRLRDAVEVKLFLDWQLNEHLRKSLDAAMAKERESSQSDTGPDRSVKGPDADVEGGTGKGSD